MTEMTFFGNFALIPYLLLKGFHLRYESRSETLYYRRYQDYKVHWFKAGVPLPVTDRQKVFIGITSDISSVT